MEGWSAPEKMIPFKAQMARFMLTSVPCVKWCCKWRQLPISLINQFVARKEFLSFKNLWHLVSYFIDKYILIYEKDSWFSKYSMRNYSYKQETQPYLRLLWWYVSKSVVFKERSLGTDESHVFHGTAVHIECWKNYNDHTYSFGRDSKR